ncbi:prepilin-type cleavage/methylation domain-containing protein [Vibrio albus]|uniref:Prepilin-type cleavage/methylation domain-containing protein n=2 Tax=Vibrio albus TaxID=2200953 RepID=A0A2U3BD32_9VIBR|nr:type IV pilin protein [Vibrio albus]PWI34696.1 prepilin-type cleavage/methylation domain-containing protein [Vibrio albus]
MIRINLCKPYKTISKGMTLLEILIVVAIITILSSIAYPSYTKHVLKAHRAQAITDMVKIQLKLEESYTSAGSYNLSLLGANCPTTLCESDSNRYTFKLTSTNTYTITATPVGVQTTDDCGTMTLNAKGTGSPAHCW